VYGSKTFLHVRDIRPLGLGPFLTLSLEIFESYNRFLKCLKIGYDFQKSNGPDLVGVGPGHEEMF